MTLLKINSDVEKMLNVNVQERDEERERATVRREKGIVSTPNTSIQGISEVLNAKDVD